MYSNLQRPYLYTKHNLRLMPITYPPTPNKQPCHANQDEMSNWMSAIVHVKCCSKMVGDMSLM